MALSQLRPNDKELPLIEMKVGDVLRALELDDSSARYEEMRRAVEGLMGKVIYRDTGDGWDAYNFFRRVSYVKSRDVLKLQFHPEIRDLLIDLKGFFQLVGNAEIAKISSEYGVRLFQLIMSWKDKAGRDGNKAGCWWCEIEIARLRKLLMIPDTLYSGSDGTTNFKKYVIENPIRKINSQALGVDIKTSYTKKGRFLHSVRFDCKLFGSDWTLEDKIDRQTLKLRQTARWKELFHDYQAQQTLPGFEAIDEADRRQMDELKADRELAKELADRPAESSRKKASPARK